MCDMAYRLPTKEASVLSFTQFSEGAAKLVLDRAGLLPLAFLELEAN
jgi:hypothetical protein